MKSYMCKCVGSQFRVSSLGAGVSELKMRGLKAHTSKLLHKARVDAMSHIQTFILK